VRTIAKHVVRKPLVIANATDALEFVASLLEFIQHGDPE